MNSSASGGLYRGTISSVFPVSAKFHYTDRTRPDRVGPDQTKSAVMSETRALA